jgi:hypothetical protein
MDLEPEVWERANRLPETGSYIYIEQVCPVRAFIGKVVLIWLNENDRHVIAVIDGSNCIINLAEDDRWVAYNASPQPCPRLTDVEILNRTHGCPCCDAPLLADGSDSVVHPWLWT